MSSENKPDLRELSGQAVKILSGEISNIPENKGKLELQEKIRDISLGGKFTIDEDGWQDYTVLNSDDPFTNLFLDSESYSKYSDDTVKNHHKEISKFLSALLHRHNQGITYQDQYPDLNVELAQRKVNKALNQLSSEKSRKEAYLALVEKAKAEGRPMLDGMLEAVLSDQRLTIAESKAFVDFASRWRYTPLEAAELLLTTVTDKGYIAESHVDENSSAYDKLLASDWASKDALERNSIAFRLVFNDKVITNLKDLGKYFYDNMKLAITLIQSKRVVESITPYYPLVAENCAGIIKKYDDEEQRYLGIIYELNPNLPFRLLPDVEISSEAELIDLVFEIKSNLMDVLLRSFNNNHLRIWWKIKNENILDLFHSTEQEMSSGGFGNNDTKNKGNQKNKNSLPAVSRDVFLAVLYQLNPALPYWYNQDHKFKSVKDFARYLVDHKEAGEEMQKQFNSGLVNIWLKYCAKITGETGARMAELYESENLFPGNFSQILGYALDPNQKFKVNNSTELSKIEEMEDALRSDQKVWSDIESLLTNKTLYYWLKFRGENKLIENYEARCSTLKNKGLLDQDTALDALLDLACPTRGFGYSITPDSVDLGKMASGSNKKLTFKITREGIGHLKGNLAVELVSESKRALVQPQILPDAITIPLNETQKEFTVDISNNGELGATVRYVVNFQSNSKDTGVPLSYQSELPLGALLLSGLGGAVTLGIFFLLMRLLVTWLTGNHAIMEFERPSFGFKWVTQIAAYEWKLFAGFVGFVVVILATFFYATFLADEDRNVK